MTLAMSDAALRWIMRFNGVPETHPLHEPWRRAPNTECLTIAEHWGAQPLDAQAARIEWARQPPA